METRLTALLNIKHPILQGAMALASDATLVAAVSNAGGAGIIAAGGRTKEWVSSEVKKTKALTNKPFGVNISLLSPNALEIVDVACEEKLAFVTIGAGNPVPHIPKLQAAGVKVIPVVPNFKLAERIEKAGADAMIIEGLEGGGHIGTQTTMALMSNVLSVPHSIPVIVAGGISDGRAMAAALLMGADGVQIGSRFILTTESPTHAAAKEAILKATDTDSEVTGFSRGTGVRSLKNDFTEEYLRLERSGAPQAELDKLATGSNRLGAVEGDIEHGTVQVGQSLNVLNDILPCKEVIERLVAEAKATLAKAKDIEL